VHKCSKCLPFNLDNVAANWKKFKRTWDNYAVVVKLQQFDKEYKTATFLSAIGEEALEIYEGMTFNPPESSKVLDSVVQKFKEYCIGQTNETFEQYLTPDHRKRMKVLITMYWHLEHLRNRVIFVSVYMIHLYVIE